MKGTTDDKHGTNAPGEEAQQGVPQGPPAFLVDEVVRIARPTGSEVDDMGDVLTASETLGVGGVVLGAVPSPDERSWVIQMGVKRGEEEGVWEVPEMALERTGVAEIREDGVAVRLPLDQAVLNPWRDDVLLTLETDTVERDDAEQIAEEAALRLRDVAGVTDVDWRLVETRNQPFEITFWVYGNGSALDVYRRITGLNGEGWTEDEDDSVFLQAAWAGKPSGQAFLSSGVKGATAVYRRWLTPARPWTTFTAKDAAAEPKQA